MIKIKVQHLYIFGGMAEWSKAAVLKTVEGNTSVGSNPTPSATIFEYICHKTFEKLSVLFNFPAKAQRDFVSISIKSVLSKEDEAFNHRHTLSISRIKS